MKFYCDISKKDLWEVIFSISENLRHKTFGFFSDNFDNLSISQIRLLMTLRRLLHHSPDGVSLKEVAEDINITPASASAMVEGLVRKGLIERKQNPTDRRGIVLKYSDNLMSKIQKSEKMYGEISAGFMAELSPDDREKLFSLLDRFNRKICE